MNRRITALVLAGVFALGLTACSAPGANGGSGDDTAFGTQSVADACATFSSAMSDTEAALTNLPTHVPGPGPSAVMLTLALPTEAPNTGFDHVMLDWNPAGHEPAHVYTLPHFDFHFYSITPAEVMAMMPSFR